MFTGLIQDIGTVETIESGADGARLEIASSLGPEIALGDSVAVNGVCLTATSADAGGFETEAMNQTLDVTALGGVEEGDRVNLELLRYVVDKGSITLSGVSLTIAELGEGWAAVSLIPETLERTNLGTLEPGDNLNVECDIVAKYVERLLAPFAGKERA